MRYWSVAIDVKSVVASEGKLVRLVCERSTHCNCALGGMARFVAIGVAERSRYSMVLGSVDDRSRIDGE